MKLNKKNFGEQARYDYLHDNKKLTNSEMAKVKGKFDNDNFELKEASKKHRERRNKSFMEEQEEELQNLSYLGNFKFK